MVPDCHVNNDVPLIGGIPVGVRRTALAINNSDNRPKIRIHLTSMLVSEGDELWSELNGRLRQPHIENRGEI